MRVRREAGGVLVIGERPVLLRVALLVGAVVVPWAVVSGQPADREPVRIGLGILAGVFLLVVALLAESRWFRFDPAVRALHWRRSRFLWRRWGELPFSAIFGATTLPRIDEDSRQGRVTYQPVLQTAMGELPLSSSFSRRVEDYDVLLGLIREVIAETSDDQEGTIVSLVRAGRTMEATALVRRALGLSLGEARQHVRRLGECLRAYGPLPRSDDHTAMP